MDTSNQNETPNPENQTPQDSTTDGIDLLTQAASNFLTPTIEKAPVVITPLSTSHILSLDLPPPAWFYKNILPKSSLVFFAGSPGSYKTFFALKLALSLSEGYKLFNWTENASEAITEALSTPPTPVNILFIEEEMHINLIQERLNLLRRSDNPLPPTHDNLHFLLSNNVKLTNPTIMKQVKDFIIQHNVKLVILDPFSSIIGTDDENDNAKISRVLDTLRREIVDDPDISASVILIHHPAKNARGTVASLRGAGDIMGKADHVMVFERDKYEPQTTISCIKSRLDDVSAMPVYEIAFRKTPITTMDSWDSDKDDYALEVHLLDCHNSRGEKDTQAKQEMAIKIKEAFTHFPSGASQTDILSHLGIEKRGGTFTRPWKTLLEVGDIVKLNNKFHLSTVAIDDTSSET